MSERSGLIDTNAPQSREAQRHTAGLPDGEGEGPGAVVDAAEVAGTDARLIDTVRPFNGYDRERSTYIRRKPDLLARAEGQFVVIVGDEIEGPLATFGDAERAGYRRFGFGPLYIKQILPEDPTQEISRDILPCRL